MMISNTKRLITSCHKNRNPTNKKKTPSRLFCVKEEFVNKKFFVKRKEMYFYVMEF